MKTLHSVVRADDHWSDLSRIESMIEQEQIWYKDLAGLFQPKYAMRFFPTGSMPVVSQLNSVFRFCVYYAIIMVILTQNARHALVILGGAMFTAAVREFAYKGGSVTVSELRDGRPKNKCTAPTEENPYMNRRVFDSPDDAPACKQWAMGTKSEDVMGEPIQDSPFQRPMNRFYTMPNTSSTNRQREFANWLYGNMPSKSQDERSKETTRCR